MSAEDCWRRMCAAAGLWTMVGFGWWAVETKSDGTPVTAEEAKQIIAERYTVPPEVRRRRRSGNQKGKIPQQPLTGGKSRPTAGHEATFPTPTVPHRRPRVKRPT